jgi:rhodanese-related sulfurtransferase
MQKLLSSIHSTALLLCLFALPSLADSLPDYKQTNRGLYISAADAYAKKLAEGNKVVLIDVRTRAEIAFVGMPTDADANIPLKHVNLEALNRETHTFPMTPNPDFVASVDKLVTGMGLDRNQPIMVMCRSGGRSAAAANQLTEQGYTQVYSVVDGFEGDEAESGPNKGLRVVNGWKNSGAPWTTELDADKLY